MNDRGRYAWVVMVALGGFAVLAAQQLTETWIVEFQARLDHDPALAAAWLRARLQWFFLLAPLLLTAGALLVVWQGVGAVRSGHSPPAGA